MGFLIEKCIRTPLNDSVLTKCAKFSCGDSDLDEFFNNDAILYQYELMGKSYCFLEIDNPYCIVAAFTVSNASIFTNHLPRTRKEKVGKALHQPKRDMIYPAVLIGRLGVSSSYKGKGIGSELLSFIKQWFVDPNNKTGCRFIIVDAYNTPATIAFYESNGFALVFPTEEHEFKYRNLESSVLHTRLMFFDLIRVRTTD